MTIKDIYDELVDSGADIMDYDSLVKKLEEGYETRKSFYDALVEDGWEVGDTYEDFAKEVFVRKQPPRTTTASPTATQKSGTPTSGTPTGADAAGTVASGGSTSEEGYDAQVAAANKKKGNYVVPYADRMRFAMGVNSTLASLEAGKQAGRRQRERQNRANVSKGMHPDAVTPELGSSSTASSAAGTEAGQTGRGYLSLDGSEYGSSLGAKNRNAEINKLLSSPEVRNSIDYESYEIAKESGDEELAGKLASRIESRKESIESRMDNDLEEGLKSMRDTDIMKGVVKAWIGANKRYDDQVRKALQEIENYNIGGEDLIAKVGLSMHARNEARMSNYDLNRLAKESWDNLGEIGQKTVIYRCRRLLEQRYPGADAAELDKQAVELAKFQTGRKLYEYAVAQNAPKNVLDYLGNKFSAANGFAMLSRGLARLGTGGYGDFVARDAATAQYEKESGFATRLAGGVASVAGMMSGPEALVGGVAGKGATMLTTRLLGNWATRAGGGWLMRGAMGRMLGTGLGGRIAGGVVGGAANLAMFEGYGDALKQFGYGGREAKESDDDLSKLYGRKFGDYSVSEAMGAAGHGAGMGALVGWMGPLVGNVSTRLTRATESTVGKVGVQAGVQGAGILAEGTVFAAPEMIRIALNDNLTSGEKKEAAMECWQSSLETMLALKIHGKFGLKGTLGTLGTIDKMSRTEGDRRGMLTRFRDWLDKSDGDMALTKSERRELEEAGWNLSSLIGTAEKGKEDRLDTEALKRMVEDGRVSQSARAKLFYYATGKGLPMSKVTWGDVREEDDGTYTVRSYSQQDGVVTCKRFKTRKEAEAEKGRIDRQVELNMFDLAEQSKVTSEINDMAEEAVRRVADYNGWDPTYVRDVVEEAAGSRGGAASHGNGLGNEADAAHGNGGGETKELSEAHKAIVSEVMHQLGVVASERGSAVDAVSKIRDEVNAGYGVDVEKAIAKDPGRRSIAEQEALRVYAERLAPDLIEEVQEAKGKIEEAAAKGARVANVDSGWEYVDPGDSTQGMNYWVDVVYSDGTRERRDFLNNREARDEVQREAMRQMEAEETRFEPPRSAGTHGRDSEGGLGTGTDAAGTLETEGVFVDSEAGTVTYPDGRVTDLDGNELTPARAEGGTPEGRGTENGLDPGEGVGAFVSEDGRWSQVFVGELITEQNYGQLGYGRDAIGMREVTMYEDGEWKTVAMRPEEIASRLETFEPREKPEESMPEPQVQTAAKEEIPENRQNLSEDPEPIGRGKLGNIYNQFAGKVKEAFDFLLRKRDGCLKGVWHREDIGDIALVWGDAPNQYSGKGLAHIIKKHIETFNDFEDIEEARMIIDDVLNNGELTLNEEGRAYIEKDGYRVVVAKDSEGQWVLSAFDTTRSKKDKKKGAAAVRTPGQPANAEGAGAVAPNLSDGKVSDFASEKQVSEQESSAEAGGALGRIPKNEKGKPDFAAAPDAATGWEGLVESKAKDGRSAERQEEMARRHAEIELANARKRLADVEKLKQGKDEDVDDYLERVESAREKAEAEVSAWESMLEAADAERERIEAEREPGREEVGGVQGDSADGTLAQGTSGGEVEDAGVEGDSPAVTKTPATGTTDGKNFDRTPPASTEEALGLIRHIVDFAKKVKDRVQRVVIGGVTERQKKDLVDKGIDIDESWVHSFDNSAVIHNQKRHGDSEVEAKNGQIAITEEDYARIPDILENYDDVNKSPSLSHSTQNEVIIYEKEYDDGYVYYLEEKRDKRKSLAFQTMYKKKKGTDSSDGLLSNTAPFTPAALSDNLSSEGKVNASSPEKQAESEKSFGHVSEAEAEAKRQSREVEERGEERGTVDNTETTTGAEAPGTVADESGEEEVRFSLYGDEAGRYSKKTVERGYGGLWIADKEEFAKFASATANNANEHDGEGVCYTANHFYAYYRNNEGVAIPFIKINLNQEDSQKLVKYVQNHRQRGENITAVIDGFVNRSESARSSGYNDSRSVDKAEGESDFLVRGLDSGTIQRGKYADVPGNYVKAVEPVRSGYDRGRSIAGKGVREAVGAEAVGQALDKTYSSLRSGVRDEVGRESGLSFVDDATGNGTESRDLASHRRDVLERRLTDLAKKDFAEFTAEERNLWETFKRHLEQGSGRTFGDNELRYLLWKEHADTENDYAAMAEDIVLKRELGLGGADEARDSEGGPGTGADAPGTVAEPGVRFSVGSVDDVWKDKSLGLDERTTAAAVQLAQAQKDDKDMARAVMLQIGGNLSKLRQAMALQKNLDRSTVKRVADLARILMQGGYMDDLTSGEVQRVLSAVKNSVGGSERQIREQVGKVLDLMSDTQIRRGKRDLESLLKMKGAKVDKNGVQVQGAIDEEASNVQGAVRSGLKMSDAELNDAIIEAENRTYSDSETISEPAKARVRGLFLAKMYKEAVARMERNLEAYAEQIKEAKEEYNAGLIEKPLYDERLAAIRDGMSAERAKLAESLAEYNMHLAAELGEGVRRAKAWRDAQTEHDREIYHFANSDMQGMDSTMHRMEPGVVENAMNALAKTLLSPLSTFEQMLRSIAGQYAIDGEGYLFNHFVRGLNDARGKEIEGVRGHYKTLDRKAKEVFGGLNWSKMMDYCEKLPDMTVRFWDKSAGEWVERKLSQPNLLYIWLADKQTDGRMKLRNMGITEGDVQAIEDFLDPRVKEIGEWLQSEFLPECREKYNETHKRMFGVSMDSIDNYFPLKIKGDARKTDIDLDKQDTIDSNTTVLAGAVHKRTVNTLDLDLMNANAFGVVLDHIEEMEHWNAFCELGRDMNTLLNYGKFRNRVKNMKTVYGNGEELWKNFRDHARIAFGTYHSEPSKFEQGALRLARGGTAACVSFRLNTALKQILSLPAVIPDINIGVLRQAMKNPAEAMTWCWENLPVLRERWEGRMSGDPRLLQSDRGWRDWRKNFMQLAARYGMTPNAAVDLFTCSLVARTAYLSRYNSYLKEGYSKEDADAKAKQDATITYNLSQQSSEGAYVSSMQVNKNWLNVVFSVFRNSPMSYTRQVLDSGRNLKKVLTSEKRRQMVEFMAKQNLRERGINPDNASEEDWEKARGAARHRMMRTVKRDIARAVTFGFVLPGLWTMGGYQLYLLFGSDDDKKKEMLEDCAVRLITAPFEGLAGGDILSNVVSSAYNGEFSTTAMTKEMPIMSEVDNICRELFKQDKATEGICDIVNLLVQSGIGVNPETFVKMTVGILDACNWDIPLAHESAINWARFMNAPESQIRELYADEVNEGMEGNSQMSPEEAARKYAVSQIKFGRCVAPWTWGDEDALEKKMSGNYGARKLFKDRWETFQDKEVNEEYAEQAGRFQRIKEEEKAAKKLMKERDKELVRQGEDALYKIQGTQEYDLSKDFGKFDQKLGDMAEDYMRCRDSEEARQLVDMMTRLKREMVAFAKAGSRAEQSAAAKRADRIVYEYEDWR